MLALTTLSKPKDIKHLKHSKRQPYYYSNFISGTERGGEQDGTDPVKAFRNAIRDSSILETDRYVGVESIYWRLTICRMTRYKRVKNKKERKST